MAIVYFSVGELGQDGESPRRNKLISSDSLSVITQPGYLNNTNTSAKQVFPTDVFDIIYGYTASSTFASISAFGTGTFGQFIPSFSSGVITLVPVVGYGNVLLPVTNGHIPKFNGTTGQISDSNIASTNLMLLSGVNLLTSSGSIVAFKVNGTEVTNAVTASGMSGVITTSSLTTAAGGSYAITWTNTFISTTSTVLLSVQGGTNTTENITLKIAPGAGTATLTIYNNTAATALNGTIFIGYLVI